MGRISGSQVDPDPNHKTSRVRNAQQESSAPNQRRGSAPIRPLEPVSNLRDFKPTLQGGRIAKPNSISTTTTPFRTTTSSSSSSSSTTLGSATSLKKNKTASSISSLRSQQLASAKLSSASPRNLNSLPSRRKLTPASNSKAASLRRPIPPTPVSLPRSSIRSSSKLLANGSMASKTTKRSRSIPIPNPPPKQTESSDIPEKLPSSLQSNSTVRPSRAGSSCSGSIDRIESSPRIKAKERAPSMNTEEPITSTRSKKLISMREKNERILATINAHLSPPTSPPSPRRTSEPPLPSPPSSPSSLASSHSASFASPTRTVPVRVSAPSVPLYVSTPENEVTGQPANSQGLTVPRSGRSGTSGLIPFATGCSPSPRKIPISLQNSGNSIETEPEMLLDVLDTEGEEAEDARLGSVRGKRTERSRLVRGSLPADLVDLSESVGNGTMASAGGGLQQTRSQNRNSAQEDDGSESQSKSRYLDHFSSGSRSEQDRAQRQRDMAMRETGRMSAQVEDDPVHNKNVQALGKRLENTSLNELESDRSRKSFDSRTHSESISDNEQDINHSIGSGTHQRQRSGSISMHTSSSDTIGRVDVSGAPRRSFPAREPVNDLSDNEPMTTTLPRQLSRRWLEDDHANDDEDNMPTPVKDRGERMRTLRHASSVSELMMSKPYGDDSGEVGSDDEGENWTDSIRSSKGHRRTFSTISGRNQRMTLADVRSISGAMFQDKKVSDHGSSGSAMRMTAGNSRRAIESPSALNDSQSPHLQSVMGSASGYTPRSPPTSHIGSFHRRQRPGLPQRFMESAQTSPDSSSSKRINSTESRRFSAQQPPSPETGRVAQTLSRHTSLRHNSLSISEKNNQLGNSQRSGGKYREPIDRRVGVESALSHYDGHRSHAERDYHQDGVRGKYSNWSEVDQRGLAPARSQSVLGGVYDPLNIGSSRVRNRARQSMSPLTPRYADPRAAEDYYEDDDDEQLSITTYNNSNTMPRNGGSNGSRGAPSDWDGEKDQDFNKRRYGAESKYSGRGKSEVNRQVEATPITSRTSVERDRTVRGSGGNRSGGRNSVTYNHSKKPSKYEASRASYSIDRMSSSSGSSRRDNNSQRSANRTGSLLSGRANSRQAPAMLTDSIARQSRQANHSNISRSAGLAGLLSPTPTVEHHKILINAYEALDQAQDSHSSGSGDIARSLVGLLSSVVRNSCKIDATVKQLNEMSLNARVDLELVEDDNGSAVNEEGSDGRPQRFHKPKLDHKIRIMEENLNQMQKTQSQLLRSSNDHIRDLTEVLIGLHKVHRSRERELLELRQGDVGSRGASTGRDRQDNYEHSRERYSEEGRSLSRASGRHSPSRSPRKRMNPIGISPLSIISSHDESPLSRMNSQIHEPVLKRTQVSDSPPSSPFRNGQLRQLPQNFNRASTISFAHDRNFSASMTPSGSGSQNRGSILSGRSMNHHRNLSKEATEVTHTSSVPFSRKTDPRERNLSRTDEFGAYRHSVDNSSRDFERNVSREGWKRDSSEPRLRDSAARTIRGTHSGAVFPRTPSRLATSSISQTTVHSNLSPTKTGRDSTEQTRGPRPDRPIRPQSSMSNIIERANSVLSRVGHHPEHSSARKETGNYRARHSSEASVESYQSLARTETDRMNGTVRRRGRSPSNEDGTSWTESELMISPVQSNNGTWSGSRDLVLKRGSSRIGNTATAALERLSQISNWSGKGEESENGIRRTISGAYGMSLGNEEIDSETGGSKWKGRRGRKASIQQLFGGLRRTSTTIQKK